MSRLLHASLLACLLTTTPACLRWIPHEPVGRPVHQLSLVAADLDARMRVPRDAAIAATRLGLDEGGSVPAAEVATAHGRWRMIVASAAHGSAIVAPEGFAVAHSDTSAAVCFIEVTPHTDLDAAVWACRSIRRAATAG